jgi:HEAT repeat protein
VTHPILRQLESQDAEQRRQACQAAAGDPSAVLLVPALVAALGDSDRPVARAASQALAELGRSHPSVALALRDALRAESALLRVQAALTLARLEPPEPRSLPALIAALDSEQGDVRWSATRLLVEMGRGRGEVLPVLISLAREGAPRARQMALAGLRELAPYEPEVARVLLGASRDPNPGVRRAAVAALVALPEPPRGVLERLTALAAEDPDAASRQLAATALARLGAAGAG